MGELQPNGAEDQSHHELQKPELASKAKRQLLEHLQPPERVADRIRGLVSGAAKEIYQERPDAEMRRIVDRATNIFLWEQMVNDTGHMLPEGLVTNFDIAHQTGERIYFDNRILSRDEYEYVIESLREKGVIDEVMALQHEHRQERHGDIKKAMADWLKNSPLTTYLKSFSITPQKEQHGRDARDLRPPEEAVLRAQLEDQFRRQYGLQGQSLSHALAQDPMLRAGYDAIVTRKIAMATVNHQKAPEAKGKEDPVRGRFRSHVMNSFWLGNTYSRFERFADRPLFNQRIRVKDGKLQFREIDEGDPERYFYDVDFDWVRYCDSEVRPLITDVFLADLHYASLGLEVTGPLLYDKSDNRKADAIIADGIERTAERVATKFETEDYQSLGQDNRSEEGRLPQANRILWLADVKGPIFTDFPSLDIDHTHSYSDLYADSEMGGWGNAQERMYHLATGFTKHVGDVTFASPAVLEVQQRHFAYWYRRDALPKVPEENVDLVLKCVSSHLAGSDPSNDTPDKEGYVQDPFIHGMKIVARDGPICYYKIDTEKPEYDLPQDDISYIRKRNIIEFCQKIGMEPLAEQLEEMGDITVAGLVQLMKQHVAYAIPEHGAVELKIKSIEDWKKYVSEDGTLQGQSELFARFAKQMLNFVYHKYTYQSTMSMQIQRSHVLYNDAFIDNHFQSAVGLTFKEDGGHDSPITRQYTIDISPPIAQLREMVADDFAARAIFVREAPVDELRELVKEEYSYYFRNVDDVSEDVLRAFLIDRYPFSDDALSLKSSVIDQSKYRLPSGEWSVATLGNGRNPLSGSAADGLADAASQGMLNTELTELDGSTQGDAQSTHQEAATIDSVDPSRSEQLAVSDDGDAGSETHAPDEDTAFEERLVMRLRRMKEVEIEQRGERQNMLPKEQYMDEAEKVIGKIIMVERSDVFGPTKIRLMHARDADPSVPATIPFDRLMDSVLQIELDRPSELLPEGREVDVAIVGLELIARDGNTFTYALDKENHDYDPCLIKLPEGKQHELALACQQIGMTSLAEELHKQDELTVEGLRQLVNDNTRYFFPEEEFDIDIGSLQDMKELVDEKGLLRGQCATFEFFMRQLLQEAFGKETAKGTGGFTLRLSDVIVNGMHAQTAFTPHGDRQYLINIEPGHIDAPRLKEHQPQPTENGIQPDEPEEKASPIEDMSPEQLAEALASLGKEDKDVTSSDQDEQHVHEDEPDELHQESELGEASVEGDDDSEVVETLSTEEQEKAFLRTQALHAVVGSSGAFVADLKAYLGIDDVRGQDYREKFSARVKRAMQPIIAKGDTKAINATLHLQLWRIVEPFEDWWINHQYRGETNDFMIPIKTVKGLKTWVDRYKSKSEGIHRLVSQGTLPAYDDEFINTMDHVLSAFEKWHEVRQEPQDVPQEALAQAA